MRNPVTITNDNDKDGNPAGGTVQGTGLRIKWQKGPLGSGLARKEPNGAFVEDVIEACAERIEFYQDGKFHCVENAVALGHLKAALEILDERTKARQDRNVEGTHII